MVTAKDTTPVESPRRRPGTRQRARCAPYRPDADFTEYPAGISNVESGIGSPAIFVTTIDDVPPLPVGVLGAPGGTG